MKAKEIQSIKLEVTEDELESINRGLRNFKEGKVHSDETARKLYEKYLKYLSKTR